MQPGLRRRPPTIHTHRPAVPRLPLLLALALSWLGAAALWACTAWPLLRQGKDERVTAGSALAGAALLASAALGVHTQRSVSGRLAALRDWARVLATRDLPRAAERMAAGRPLDVARLVPEPRLGDDELGRTAAEVCAAQRAALDLAAQQYAARENVRAVFLSLARRLQPLLHQQLGVLDVMERDHEDPDLLHQLFAVDHLSTRLRRHAENLVILGGARPPRQWRYAVPLMDVVRSAVSETAEYTRVEVEKLPNGTVCGHAVSDVVHLLAELLENGCTFSPPHTRVTISGEEVSHGLVLEIEDRGLGMSDEQYRRLNATLSAPARLTGDTGDTGDTAAELGTDGRLGMFVVAGLAQRHSVDVELRRSPYGGTRVIVLLPRGIAAGSDGLPQCQPPMPGPGPDAAGSALDGPERAEDLRDPGDPGDPGSSGDLADLADLADLGSLADPTDPTDPDDLDDANDDPEDRDPWSPAVALPEQSRGPRHAAVGPDTGSHARAEGARATMAAIQRATRLARRVELPAAEPPHPKPPHTDPLTTDPPITNSLHTEPPTIEEHGAEPGGADHPVPRAEDDAR